MVQVEQISHSQDGAGVPLAINYNQDGAGIPNGANGNWSCGTTAKLGQVY
jgi:hypothetical protein